MAQAYYSTVMDNSVEEVWDIVKDFNDDRWSGDVTESESENGKSGSTVGTIRVHTFGDKTARSDLKAYSTLDHSLTYGFVGKPPLPIEDYISTLRVTPVIEGNRAFVEWSATFDCAETQRAEITTQLINSYRRWLGSLQQKLSGYESISRPR